MRDGWFGLGRRGWRSGGKNGWWDESGALVLLGSVFGYRSCSVLFFSVERCCWLMLKSFAFSLRSREEGLALVFGLCV
jgi:hypothetical protein